MDFVLTDDTYHALMHTKWLQIYYPWLTKQELKALLAVVWITVKWVYSMFVCHVMDPLDQTGGKYLPSSSQISQNEALKRQREKTTHFNDGLI